MFYDIRAYRLKKYRRQAFKKQGGRCFYCRKPMWLGSAEEFADKYGITEIQAEPFQCTTEHLVARQDGGKDVRENIAAACLRCNSERHHVPEALPHNKYGEHVRSLEQSQEWHSRETRHML